MSKLISSLVLLGLVFGTWSSSARAEDKAEEEAKRASAAFMKGLQTKDLKGLVEASGVPWINTLDKWTILRNPAELEKQFEAILNSGVFSALTFEVKEVIPYRKLRDSVPGADRKVGDEAMGEGGMVVLLQVIRNKGGDKEKWVIMVGKRGGKAKVVGLDVK